MIATYLRNAFEMHLFWDLWDFSSGFFLEQWVESCAGHTQCRYKIANTNDVKD